MHSARLESRTASQHMPDRRACSLYAVSGGVKPRINGEQRVAEATTCRVERQGVASRQAALRLLRCAPALRVTGRNPLTQLAFMAGSRLPAVNDPLCEITAIQKVNPHILCSPLFGAFGSPSTYARRPRESDSCSGDNVYRVAEPNRGPACRRHFRDHPAAKRSGSNSSSCSPLRRLKSKSFWTRSHGMSPSSVFAFASAPASSNACILAG